MPNATAKVLTIIPAGDDLNYNVTLQVTFGTQLVNTTALVPSNALETSGVFQAWLVEWLTGYKETLPSPDPYAIAYNGTTVSV